jgi:hypothetical protein
VEDLCFATLPFLNFFSGFFFDGFFDDPPRRGAPFPPGMNGMNGTIRGGVRVSL